MPYPSRPLRPRALPSLANKGWYRQLTAATTLCTGRAAPLSTCGNKPACDNALLVTNKNGARGSVVQCSINPGRNALRALPAPLPTSVCTTSYCDDVVHWKSDEPLLRSQSREERAALCDRDHARVCSWIKKRLTGPPGSSAGCPLVHHSVTASSPLARSGDHWSPSPVAARTPARDPPAGCGPPGSISDPDTSTPARAANQGAAPARCPPSG